MSDLVKYTLRLVILMFIQVYILNPQHLHKFVVPYIYYVFILWLPFSISRTSLLFVGFFTGLILDYFSMQIGIHAAACTLIAYARPFVINILMPKEAGAYTYREPSPKAMGWTPYAIYLLILTFLHHGYMVFLHWLDFGRFFDFLIKVFATTGISMLLVLTVELVFPRRLKFRTNTA